HLLEGVRDIGPAAELRVHERIDAAGPPALGLLVDEVEAVFERLKRFRAEEPAAVPAAQIVEEPLFGNNHDALAVDALDVRRIVVAGIAPPRVARVRENAHGLRRVIAARADPADRTL